ncbi:MAG: glycosyltransferase [Chitinophagales bacterium]|nr:glycosyltransferase [Chitinophagales bacterium]
MAKPRILIAPLDWGLGHATRCIPLVECLIAQGAEPIIASDGRALKLLQQAFPEQIVVPLKGYAPSYPANSSMVWGMGRQLPKFVQAILRENQEVQGLVKRYALKGIISDNRYGLYHAKVRSVFITHQLNILMPPNAQWLSSAVDYTNNRFIARFHECWVPDNTPPNHLAGKLSERKGRNVKYLGILSRLKPLKDVPKLYDILVLLSGPEPQRTLLEKILLKQLGQLSYSSLFVRGITESKQSKTKGQLRMVDHLESNELEQALAASDMVIARSGYSTIMDLLATQKQALLVPTPGQTEQEYLATHLHERDWFHTVGQQQIDLRKDLPLAAQYKPPMLAANNHYRETIAQFLDKL